MTLAEVYMEKGKQEGKKEGRKEGKIEVAKTLLSKNFPLDEIAEITKLSVKEIGELKDK